MFAIYFLKPNAEYLKRFFALDKKWTSFIMFYSLLQVKPKMVMTVFAVLMSSDYVPNMDSKKGEN